MIQKAEMENRKERAPRYTLPKAKNKSAVLPLHPKVEETSVARVVNLPVPTDVSAEHLTHSAFFLIQKRGACTPLKESGLSFNLYNKRKATCTFGVYTSAILNDVSAEDTNPAVFSGLNHLQHLLSVLRQTCIYRSLHPVKVQQKTSDLYRHRRQSLTCRRRLRGE